MRSTGTFPRCPCWGGREAGRTATFFLATGKPLALAHDEASWAQNRRADLVYRRSAGRRGRRGVYVTRVRRPMRLPPSSPISRATQSPSAHLHAPRAARQPRIRGARPVMWVKPVKRDDACAPRESNPLLSTQGRATKNQRLPRSISDDRSRARDRALNPICKKHGISGARDTCCIALRALVRNGSSSDLRGERRMR